MQSKTCQNGRYEIINHSLHFTDPGTGAYTNSIFSMTEIQEVTSFRVWDGKDIVVFVYGGIRMKKTSGGNALYHPWPQIAEHYLPP